MRLCRGGECTAGAQTEEQAGQLLAATLLTGRRWLPASWQTQGRSSPPRGRSARSPAAAAVGEARDEEQELSMCMCVEGGRGADRAAWLPPAILHRRAPGCPSRSRPPPRPAVLYCPHTSPFFSAATCFSTSAPMQSLAFWTGLPSSSARRGATGVRRNLSSGPFLGRPRWEVSSTCGSVQIRGGGGRTQGEVDGGVGMGVDQWGRNLSAGPEQAHERGRRQPRAATLCVRPSTASHPSTPALPWRRCPAGT